MGKKKSSESRKHTAMIRVTEHARERADLASRLMNLSLADYASSVLAEAAERDIQREAKKLAGGAPDPSPKSPPKKSGKAGDN